MSNSVGVLLCLMFLLAVALCEEPQCSRFHYEEQTLLKLVKLEVKMEQIEKELTKIDKLEKELTDLIEKDKKQEPESVLRLQKIQNNINDLLNKEVTSHYVRWGRDDCPGNGTNMLYNGYMAGNKWDKHGGGVNSLCLPKSPTWASYNDGYQSGSLIYGTEIEVDSSVSAKLFGSNVHNNDLSCALCTTNRASVVMFPGHSKCLAGWTTEYQGYLVASHPEWKGSSDFVCIDSNFLKHQDRGGEERCVKPVEVKCGVLPCPPYVEGREVACVVCSK